MHLTRFDAARTLSDLARLDGFAHNGPRGRVDNLTI